MKTYFGIVNNETVNQMTPQQQLDYMIANKLLYVSMTMEDATKTTTNNNLATTLKPTSDVSKSFYSYLKELIAKKTATHFVQFYTEFNDSIYGLEESEQRKIALQEFKKIFTATTATNINIIQRIKDNNGVEQVSNMNRFDLLKAYQNGQQQQLATFNNTLEYLNGNAAYFTTASFMEQSDMQRFIAFESNLKILVSLNSRYQFEQDFQFSDAGLLKELYEHYTHIFISFDVFVSVHQTIQQLQQHKTAVVVSLFEALVNLNLIHNHKSNFIRYLNTEHQMTLTKLKYFEPGENRQHDQRVQQFMLELQPYAS